MLNVFAGSSVFNFSSPRIGLWFVFVPRFAEFYVIDIDDYPFACALLEIPLTGALLYMHSYLLCM